MHSTLLELEPYKSNRKADGSNELFTHLKDESDRFSQAIISYINTQKLEYSAYDIKTTSTGRLKRFRSDLIAATPWISFNGEMKDCNLCIVFLFPRKTDKKKGTDASHFCLSINISNQKYQDPQNQDSKHIPQYIAHNYIQHIDTNDSKCSIGNQLIGQYGSYSESNIKAYEYSWSDLPSDETIKSNIDTLLHDYKSLKDAGELSKFDSYVSEAQKYVGDNNTAPIIDSEQLNSQHSHETMPSVALNTIWYGAPGTGKSYALNKELEEHFSGRYERVTFYADYLHSHFVGSYKPITVPGKDEKGNDIRRIEYQFRPGPFTRVLIRALNDQKQDNNYALVIEELNRAEAASVFGDVFQLLDRRKDGRSEYAITISEDLREYLLQSKEGDPNYLTDKGRKNLQDLTHTHTGDCSQIVIPGNMYILATMNSADQGVFPLDTAFKRRWDFEYVGIDDGADAKTEDGESVIKDSLWVNKIRKTINENLLNNGVAEDKQMGPFFLGDPDLIMDIEPGDHRNDPFDKAMKNKVIMYLFDDAAKYRPEIVFDTDTTLPNKDQENKEKLSLQKLFDAWDKYDYGIFKGQDPMQQRTATNSTEQQPDETSSDDSAPADDMTGDTADTPITDVSTADSATPQTEE